MGTNRDRPRFLDWELILLLLNACLGRPPRGAFPGPSAKHRGNLSFEFGAAEYKTAIGTISQARQRCCVELDFEQASVGGQAFILRGRAVLGTGHAG